MTTRQPPVKLSDAVMRAGNLPGGNGYGVYRPKQANGVWHWGLDIANPVGADVVAPEDGTVAYRWDDNKTAPFVGYGPGGVLLKGASGLYHLLGHTNPAATVGELVQGGEVVGHTGDLGAVASHCHWEVRVKPIDSPATRGGNTLNPIAWLKGDNTPPASRWGWVLAALMLYVVSRSR